jgi:hypothetical protein
VLLEWVRETRDLEFHFADDFVEHRLRRHLVRRQGHAPYGTVLTAEAPPPFFRPLLNLTPGLPVDDNNLLPIHVCHLNFS